ncbi:hypothetical protein CK203_034819 [Vitis vinifera]|uniref:Uncharacterized protein n=1 Tax=Vitis vinifera TaxID=29760 RepID=A0A438IC15_VITVI|nr:hypothetical protein CK203_034819 [Vitis vinifera]
MSLDNSSPTTMLHMEIPTFKLEEPSKFLLEAKSTSVHTTRPSISTSFNLEQAIVNLSKVVGDFVGDQKSINAQLSQRIVSVENTLNKMMDGMQNDLSQKIDNLQYSISRLTNLNTVQERGGFLLNLTKTPRVSMKWKLMKGESSQCKSLEVQRSGLPYHLSDDWRNCSGESFVRLGASVNLLPYSVYKQLGLSELKPTSITLSLADRSVKIPRGIIEDVLVQVDNFYYPVDFVVLDTDPIVKETNYVPIILGRPFLATSKAIITCRNGLMQLTFGNMTLELNIFYMSKKPINPEEDEDPEEVCIRHFSGRALLEEDEKFYLCSIKRRHNKLLKRNPKA